MTLPYANILSAWISAVGLPVSDTSLRRLASAQLIDAESTAHLWADHFDGSLEDVLDLQDQVAIRVAAVIEPELEAAEIRRALDRPRNDPTAYDLYLRALRAMRSWENKGYMEALDQVSHATRLDATYGPALRVIRVVPYGAQRQWLDRRP